MFLGVGDDGNGGSIDIQYRSADDEIFQLPSQRQTECRASTTADVPGSDGLQYESCQEISLAGYSECSSVAQSKAIDW